MKKWIAICILSLSPAWLTKVSADDGGCFSNAVYKYRDIQAFTDLFHPVLDIEGSTRNYTSEYARKHGMSQKAADKIFDAVGAIVCKGQNWGSASLTGANNVIVGAAHTFMDTDRCTPRPNVDLKQCTFETSSGNSPVSVEISSSPSVNCQQDWIVLKLKKAVPKSVQPLRLGDSGDLRPGDHVIAVNGTNRDFFLRDSKGKYVPNSRGQVQAAKSIADCDFKEKFWVVSEKLATTCGGTVTSSGSGLLNDKHELVGVLNRAYGEEEDDLNYRLFHESPFYPKSCSYDVTRCASFYQPITDDLRKAVAAASAPAI